jgi:methylglyoxal/glyoxal reductase
LLNHCEVAPMVNQVEFHPLLTQKPLLTFCKAKNIQLEAWSPLMRGNLDNPLLTALAAQYGKTPAQVVLRWDLQHGVVTIPKSVRDERITANANVFACRSPGRIWTPSTGSTRTSASGLTRT